MPMITFKSSMFICTFILQNFNANSIIEEEVQTLAAVTPQPPWMRKTEVDGWTVDRDALEDSCPTDCLGAHAPEVVQTLPCRPGEEDQGQGRRQGR